MIPPARFRRRAREPCDRAGRPLCLPARITGAPTPCPRKTGQIGSTVWPTRRFRGLIWLMHRLPWRARIRTMGWLFANIVGPAAGYSRRAHENLKMIFPDMSAQERKRIVRASLDNVGRTIIENYSPEDQLRDVAVLQPRGPGWPAIEAARRGKRPIIFVSAHFGNWQAARAALNQRGYDIGRPLPAVQQPLRQCPLRGVHRTGRRAGLCPVRATGSRPSCARSGRAVRPP